MEDSNHFTSPQVGNLKNKPPMSTHKPVQTMDVTSTYFSVGQNYGLHWKKALTADVTRELPEPTSVYDISELELSTLDQGFTNNTPVKFDENLAKSMAHFVQDLVNREIDLRFVKVPSYFTQIVGTMLKKFMCSLQAYMDSFGAIMESRDLINGLTKKDFAATLKSFRKKAFFYSCRLSIPEDYIGMEKDIYTDDVNELFDKYQTRISGMSDIGQIFNYNYFFFWEEEDEFDYQWGYLPVEDISIEDIKVYKDILLSLLPDDIGAVNESEIIYSAINSSTSINNKFEKVRKLDTEYWKFSDYPLTGRRARVPVGPAGYRDTVILPIEQTNSIRLIEKQCHYIVERLKYSAHFQDPGKFERKLEKFRAKYNYFFDRDIKKEGITKPHQLMKITLEVLKEKYPDFPAWRYSGIYDSYRLLVDDQLHIFKRGYGLGMANSLTTIIQCALFTVTLKYYNENFEQSGKISALFLNDDCEIGIQYEEDLAEFIDADDEILKRYQVVRSAKKSSYGQCTVFCEIYYQEGVDLSKKESYKLNEIYQCFAQQNITVAKTLVSNLSSQILVSDIREYMKDIISFWGYEFYIGEWNQPYSIGGWISPTLIGVKLDAIFVDQELTYDQRRAWHAISTTGHPKKWLRKIDPHRPFYDPLFILYGTLNLPEKDKVILNHMQTYRSMRERYYKPANDRENSAIISKYKNSRYLAFKRAGNQRLTRDKFFLEMKEYYSEKDVMPPFESIVSSHQIEDRIIPKPKFVNVNPMMSYLEYYNRGLFPKVPPERYSWKNNSIRKKMTAEERRAIFKYVELFRGNEYVDEVCYYEDFYCSSSWRNNGNMLSAYATLTGRVELPEVADLSRERITDGEVYILNSLSGPYGKYVERLLNSIGQDVLNHVDEIHDLIDTIPYREIPSEDEFHIVLGDLVRKPTFPDINVREIHREILENILTYERRQIILPSGEIRIEQEENFMQAFDLGEYEFENDNVIAEIADDEIDDEEEPISPEEEITIPQEIGEDAFARMQANLAIMRQQLLNTEEDDEEEVQRVEDEYDSEDEYDHSDIEEEYLDDEIIEEAPPEEEETEQMVPLTEININDHGVCGFGDFATWRSNKTLPVLEPLEVYYRRLDPMFFNLTNTLISREDLLNRVPVRQLVEDPDWETYKAILVHSNAEFDAEGLPTGHWNNINLLDDPGGDETGEDLLFDGLW
jgi:hypothetical protein